MKDIEPDDYTLFEREYWKSATRVLTGLSWFLLGIISAVIISLIF